MYDQVLHMMNCSFCAEEDGSSSERKPDRSNAPSKQLAPCEKEIGIDSNAVTELQIIF